jgi:hypothetical protein
MICSLCKKPIQAVSDLEQITLGSILGYIPRRSDADNRTKRQLSTCTHIQVGQLSHRLSDMAVELSDG